MSRWAKYRKCEGCKYMNPAGTQTGYGCYQSKEGVYEVYPERPACARFELDVPNGYAPIRSGCDVWDYSPGEAESIFPQ